MNADSNEVKRMFLDLLQAPEMQALSFLGQNYLLGMQPPDLDNTSWDDNTKRRVLSLFWKKRAEKKDMSHRTYGRKEYIAEIENDEKEAREKSEEFLKLPDGETLAPLTPDDIRGLIEEAIDKKFQMQTS